MVCQFAILDSDSLLLLQRNVPNITWMFAVFFLDTYSTTYNRAVHQFSMFFFLMSHRGLSCGLHETISQEECHQIVRKVRAAVAVVENHSLMCMILMVRSSLLLKILQCYVYLSMIYCVCVLKINIHVLVCLHIVNHCLVCTYTLF